MAGLVGALSSGNRYADTGDGTFHLVPNEATAAADGYDWNDVFWFGTDDALPGSIGDPLLDASAPPPAAPSSAPASSPSSSPSSFTWGAITWTPDDLTRFIAYLAAHGVDYSTWANNHPDAAAIFAQPSYPGGQEPMPKSLGQALTAAIQAGATPAQAAQQAEALRAALVAQGTSSVTPAQLLAGANVVAQTLAAEPPTPPPSEPPVVGPPPPPSDRSLQSVDTSQRERGDLSNLPPIPAGFRTVALDNVTEGLVIAAALITHADPWIMLGTCKAESGFNVETNANSAGAKGPMQLLAFPDYTGAVPLVQWVWGNLIAGGRMLANYDAAYDGSQPKISAAYNAGPGAVNTDWPGVLHYLEVKGNPSAGTVQDYVDKVAQFAGQYRLKFGGGWNIDPDTGDLINGAAPPAATSSPPASPYTPAGVVANWRDLVGFFKTTVPARRAAVQSALDHLLEVYK